MANTVFTVWALDWQGKPSYVVGMYNRESEAREKARKLNVAARASELTFVALVYSPIGEAWRTFTFLRNSQR